MSTRWVCCVALLFGCDSGGGGGSTPTDAGATSDLGGDASGAADGAPQSDARADDDASAPDAGDPLDELSYEPCPAETRIGGFSVQLTDAFTGVQGQVTDAVDPAVVGLQQGASVGGCRLMRPPSLFCQPACPPEQACAGDDRCVARPEAQDVGTVVVEGLKAPVEMTARAPVFFYTFTGDLPHPGFDPGDAIVLRGGGAEPFTLVGRGIPKLQVSGDTLALEAGTDAALEWTAPDDTTAIGVRIVLNIANHGGTPAWIECEAPDTGRFDIPAALIDTLLDLGFSGFPSVGLTRRTADSTDLAIGCVDFQVLSEVVLDVDIPGLVSCDADDQCPDGQVCRVDLTCGPME